MIYSVDFLDVLNTYKKFPGEAFTVPLRFDEFLIDSLDTLRQVFVYFSVVLSVTALPVIYLAFIVYKN